MRLQTLVVIAKEPVAGQVKTRLTSRVSPDQAAAAAAGALSDTLGVLSGIPAHHRVLLLQGQPGAWVPDEWQVRPQISGGLDQRLAEGIAALPGPLLLVGMDTPQMTPADCTFDHTRFDCCLGLAEDGGFWAMGFADTSRARETICGVPMSTDHTGAAQLRRLRSAGLTVQPMPTLRDVDHPADADAVARLVPDSHFARAWQAANQTVAP